MKNLILILAMAVSAVSFSQIAIDAFAYDKPLQDNQVIDDVYKITRVSHCIRENNQDEFGKYILGEVDDLVNQYVFYRGSERCFFLPTINSGVIPTVVGDIIGETYVEGEKCVQFEAKYLFQGNIIECNVYLLIKSDTETVLFFHSDLLIIAYEITYEGTKPQGRIY